MGGVDKNEKTAERRLPLSGCMGLKETPNYRKSFSEEQRNYEGVFVVVFLTAAFFLATFFLATFFLAFAFFFAAIIVSLKVNLGIV